MVQTHSITNTPEIHAKFSVFLGNLLKTLLGFPDDLLSLDHSGQAIR